MPCCYAASSLSWSYKVLSSPAPPPFSFPPAKLKQHVDACPPYSLVASRVEAISLSSSDANDKAISKTLVENGLCKGASEHSVSSRINSIINDNASASAEARPTLREFCKGMLPEAFLRRAEEMGFVYPTDVQMQALPALLAGQDCILHSQTGSGKTMCYLFSIFAKVNSTRAAVQAVVLVPTRELGMQVVREARRLAKMHVMEDGSTQTLSEREGSLSVMTLLDGGSLKRQKIWLKADTPQMVVGTLQCVCKMIETKNLRTHAINTLVIDEVDAMFGQKEHIALLRALLTKYTLPQNRQTVFASATIAQYTQFVDKCVSEKWVKEKMVYVQANPGNKMPVYIRHRHVVCGKDEKLAMLKMMLCADKPKAAIIFVNEQSEVSKRKGEIPTTNLVVDFLSSSAAVTSSEEESLLLQPLVLEENANIHVRTASLTGFPNGKRLLVATDLAARGLDIPEISHVYNFELPPSATAYIHRGGRTARKPLTTDEGIVTSFVSKQELFVFERYQNEVMFQSEEKTATW